MQVDWLTNWGPRTVPLRQKFHATLNPSIVETIKCTFHYQTIISDKMIRELKKAYLYFGCIYPEPNAREFIGLEVFNRSGQQIFVSLDWTKYEIVTNSGQIMLEYQDGPRRKEVWSDEIYTNREYSQMLSDESLFFLRKHGIWFCRINGVWFTADDDLERHEIVALAKSLIDKKRRVIQNSLSYADSAFRSPTGARRKIADDVKIAVWNRDKGACVECGSTDEIQYDHIIPFSQGGSDAISNLQILCGRCNRIKGSSLTVTPVSPTLRGRRDSGSESRATCANSLPYIQIPLLHRSFDIFRLNQITVAEKLILKIPPFLCRNPPSRIIPTNLSTEMKSAVDSYRLSFLQQRVEQEELIREYRRGGDIEVGRFALKLADDEWSYLTATGATARKNC